MYEGSKMFVFLMKKKKIYIYMFLCIWILCFILFDLCIHDSIR